MSYRYLPVVLKTQLIIPTPVEPIYLQADTAAYPELRYVVLMHGDDLRYGETFEEALEGLFVGDARPRLDAAGVSVTRAELARRANQAFDDYLRLQSKGSFVEAGEELERLRELLQRLAADEDQETAN